MISDAIRHYIQKSIEYYKNQDLLYWACMSALGLLVALAIVKSGLLMGAAVFFASCIGYARGYAAAYVMISEYVKKK